MKKILLLLTLTFFVLSCKNDGTSDVILPLSVELYMWRKLPQVLQITHTPRGHRSAQGSHWPKNNQKDLPIIRA